MSKNPKLVYIEWCDALSNSSWRSREEAEEWGDTDNWIVRNVGWLLKETKEYILFSSRWNVESKYSDEQWGLLQKIPKTWIRKRKVLNV